MATTGEKIKMVIALNGQRQAIQSVLKIYRTKYKNTGELTPHEKRKVRRLEHDCKEVEDQLKVLLPPDTSISNF